MAKRKINARKSNSEPRPSADGVAKFPYTVKPASLRRLLKDIPKKPKPQKFDPTLLKSWDFRDTNDRTMLRVLKAVGLLNDRNEPTELYAQFMSLDNGAKVLGPEIQRVYAPLFQASHSPYTESNEKLKNLFHIHSAGGDSSLDFQIQTFKALCENASFDAPISATGSAALKSEAGSIALTGGQSSALNSSININLHIHLPENKTRRDYEAIIEDIGRYIFGRTGGDQGA